MGKYLVELLAEKYLCEIIINFLSLVNIYLYFSRTPKKSSKKREEELEHEMIRVFKYVSDRKKKAGKKKLR